MSKALVLVLVLGAGLFAAQPASAHGFMSATIGKVSSDASSFFASLSNPPVGAPAPLLASGLPSIIMLAGAAFIFRRRRA